MRGWLDKVNKHIVEGWLVGDDVDNQPRTIVIYADDELAAEGIATVSRKVVDVAEGETNVLTFAINIENFTWKRSSYVIRAIDIITGWEIPPLHLLFADREFENNSIKKQTGEINNKPKLKINKNDNTELTANVASQPLPTISGIVQNSTEFSLSGSLKFGDVSGVDLYIEARLGGRLLARTLAVEAPSENNGPGSDGSLYRFSINFNEPVPFDAAPTFFILCALGTWVLDLTEPSQLEIGQGVVAADSNEYVAFEGALDIVTEHKASGWAWNPSWPEEVLTVEALRHGEVIGKAFAELPRYDLAEHGKGTGKYGFEVEFVEPLDPENLPTFRAVGSVGSLDLPGPTELQFSASVATKREKEIEARAFGIPDVEGHIDRLTREEAAGWAWAPSAPDQAVRIEAYVSGKIVGHAIADMPRPDLREYGKGTGNYGFQMKFRDELIGSQVPEFRILPAMGRVLASDAVLPPVRNDSTASRKKSSAVQVFGEHAAFTSKGPLFEEFDGDILKSEENESNPASEVKLIAFYLPQFHAIPENDLFWGKGFTEWRQLARGIPRFPGHYQPRIPHDLGFYNLENIEAFAAQVEMAIAAGINGFGYYYYWFNRRRILSKPLDLFLSSDVDFPFMLIWANENWTRTWDGSESEVLLKQDYALADEDALLEDLAGYFLDGRYIRIDNRPLFVIYSPKNVPDSKATLARWRMKLAEKVGQEPLIFMAQTFGEVDPRDYGLDGAIEFPPHKLSNELPGRPTPDAFSKDFSGRVIAYDDFVTTSLNEVEPEYPLIKTIVPSWDNDSRRPNRGLTLEGSSPSKYQAWLTELMRRSLERPIHGSSIVAVNAWNEWAEGAYLEPDVHFGAAYLNSTARARRVLADQLRSDGAMPDDGQRDHLKVSVILPNFNHEKYIEERIYSVLNQTRRPDEIIFLDDCSTDNSVSLAVSILEDCGVEHRVVINDENSGNVFKQWIKGLQLARNELIWIAETDDSADLHFLANLLPAFEREDVMASFGRISGIGADGTPRGDLDGYFDGLKNFTWNARCIVSAFQAFSHDFAIKNVIPNASGLVFRKPKLTETEVERLFQYRFAGDWYFYALLLRGGSLAYSPNANSYFRINDVSASRSAFRSNQHLAEHKMIVEDLRREYDIPAGAIEKHCDALAAYMPGHTAQTLRAEFDALSEVAPQRGISRICVAANGFSVGGGEILPIELANALKNRGCHVTYLAIERPTKDAEFRVRKRLRSDIPVVFWDSVSDNFGKFLAEWGFQAFNSHNVSVDYRLFLKKVEFRVPYIASLHGGYETVPNLLTADFQHYLADNVRKWLYLSPRNYEFLAPELRGKSEFIRCFNAVPRFEGEWIDRGEFRRQENIRPDAFVFMVCSRAIPEKGWDVAIDAVQKLAAERLPVHLVLIGDGPAAEELRTRHAKLKCVSFLGSVDTPMRYFRCFDMGVFPSTYAGETFPLFLLECFAAGLPVLATDVGEIPQILAPNKYGSPGMLVDHRGGKGALTAGFIRAMRSIAKSPPTYRKFRQAAESASDRFSIDALCRLYLGVFAPQQSG